MGNDVLVILLAMINCGLLISMYFMNHNWRKVCEKQNLAWYKHCNDIIESLTNEGGDLHG